MVLTDAGECIPVATSFSSLPVIPETADEKRRYEDAGPGVRGGVAGCSGMALG